MTCATRGSVMVEFLLAFMPMFTFFECLVQLAGLYTADLVAHHATWTAARAAAVVLADDPRYYGDGDKRRDIETAARMPLSAVGSIDPGSLQLHLQRDADHVVHVELKVEYACSVPLGNVVVCGADRRRAIVARAALPDNRADYDY